TKFRTRQDWISAGAVVFESANGVAPLNDTPYRDLEWYREFHIPLSKDGIMPFGRYLIREKGVVEIAFDSCAMCHTRVLPDGSMIRGAQGSFPEGAFDGYLYQRAVRRHTAAPEESVRADYWKEYGAPWAVQPELGRIPIAELMELAASIPPGV